MIGALMFDPYRVGTTGLLFGTYRYMTPNGVRRNRSEFPIPNSKLQLPFLVQLPGDAEGVAVRFDDDLDVFAIAAAH
jgi:hypothetical protein